MLHQRIPPTKRTFGLFPNPIPNTLPTKDVSTRRSRRVLELLQTQRALPLLRALDEAHDLVVAQVEPRLRSRRRVRGGGQVDPARLGSAAAKLRQQQVAVG